MEISGIFKVEISLGNAEMCRTEHIAHALASVVIATNDGKSSGIIWDANGNRVGQFFVEGK